MKLIRTVISTDAMGRTHTVQVFKKIHRHPVLPA